jgi:hypothetical protein
LDVRDGRRRGLDDVTQFACVENLFKRQPAGEAIASRSVWSRSRTRRRCSRAEGLRV